MPLTNLNATLAIPDLPNAAASAPNFGNTRNLNGVGLKAANIVSIPRSGSISRIHFRTAAQNAGNVYTVSVETINADGEPSGTLWNAGAQVTGVTGLASNTSYSVTLGSTANVSAGDVVAIVFTMTTAVANGNFSGYADGSAGSIGIPCLTDFNGTNWSVANSSPMFALEYNDGTFAPILGSYPFNSINTTNLTSTSTPRIFGNIVTPNLSCRMTGFWFWSDTDGDVEMILFDNDGSTQLATFAVDKDLPVTSTAAQVYVFYLQTPITLVAGRNYYLMFRATTATASAFYSADCYSAEALKAKQGGEIFRLATAATSTPSSAADFTISTTEQAFAGILIDQIDTGSSEISHAYVS